MMDDRPESPALILFVDDNPALLRSVERLLQMEGYDVVLASDGQEALRLMESPSRLPDLIISDIMMPKMDGFELYEKFRKRVEWAEIPFIFLTALDQVDVLRQAYSLGADDYIVKPLDNERLLSAVQGRLLRQKMLRERIRSQQRELEKVRQELATMVAHELRTPLVSITMVADILASEMELLRPEQVREMLDAMQSGQVRLHRLVEQMVMYIEMKSGMLATTIQNMRRPQHVHDVLIDAVRHTERMNYRQREIPIHLKEEHPDAMILCDPNSLRQALTEVLLNAIAFSRPGDEILVTQRAEEQLTSIAVCDHGPGIPEAEWERVFEPFHQVNRQWFEQQGIGIGLTLAKGVVDLHGGRIDLHSGLEQGAQFTITLPLYSADSSD